MSKKMPLKVQEIVKDLLNNRYAIGCLSIMAIQQMIETSSTLWLVKLTMCITSGENYFPYLLLYLGSLLLAYIPNCIGLILKTSWKQEVQRTFINSFVSSNKNNIGEWSNKGIKEEKLAILTAEGPNTLHTLIDYVWDLYTYVLSVLFTILALSIVVEPLFAISYGVSVACVIAVMQMKRKTQRQLTKKALIARVDLCQSLLAAWDNVLLGNDYNFKLWNERTSQRLNRCLQRNVDLERFDQILAISVALITSLPSLAVVIYFMLKNSGDIVRLTSLVVILPSLFMILSYTYQTLSLAFRWAMHRSKLLTIYRAMQPSPKSPAYMEKKIKWPKIVANYAESENVMGKTPVSIDRPLLSQPMKSHLDLLSQTAQAGRLTLRGENGSGKSTALMLIKNALAGRAFFLPTHNQLSFSAESNKFSTGESLRNRLMEILEKVEADVLLLDEWDANLDKDNQERLSMLIDELSDKKCVIEVRHR
jgi:ABC-type transport system involved in cytochrome bd biosynthesis fused ATPase/permease subunit